MTDVLPPANPNARGLYLTDEEWRALCDLLEGEPAVLQAQLYGSRQKGERRNPDKPLDIDLAISVRSDDPTQQFQEFWDVSERLKERAGAGGLCLHIEDLSDTAGSYYSDQLAGVTILHRA